MDKFIMGLVALLSSLTRFSLDTETDSARHERMQQTAAAVDQAVDRATCTGEFNQPTCRRVWNGSKRDLAAAIVALGFHETHYAQKISEGRCHELPKGMRCDNGRARSYWQTWAVACPEVWQTDPGSEEEVKAGAWCAARLLSSAYRMCQGETDDDWAAAFSRYGGRSCKSQAYRERSATLRRLLTKM